MERAMLLAIYNTAQTHNQKLKLELLKLKKEVKKELAKVYHALDNDVTESAQKARRIVANLVRTRLQDTKIEKVKIDFEDNNSMAAVAEEDEEVSNESKVSSYTDLLTGQNF